MERGRLSPLLWIEDLPAPCAGFLKRNGMLRFATLYSGSSGNCTLVYNRGTAVLIDLGVSCRRVVSSLNALGLSPADIKGVLITHEHSDHIGGCEVFLRKYGTPVYCTPQTRNFLLQRHLMSPGQKCVELDGRQVEIGDMTVTPFRTSHDSATCMGYRIECGNAAVAVATDIGTVTEDVYEYLRGCGIVALESNYDEYMLRHGPYPRALQNRIAARNGHLSNDECAATVSRLVQDGTSRIMLMHLSAENNTPETALTRCRGELENRGLDGLDTVIETAPRYCMSDVWELG